MKQERVLELLFRGIRGEDISVKKLAGEYKVSTKSISRSINDLKVFLADHRELVGNTELRYSYSDKCYHLYIDEFLTNKELFSLVEVIIGARAFSKMELVVLIDKLKKFTTPEERLKMNNLIRKELYHYPEIKHDCKSVRDNLWKIVNCITDRKEISIEYYRTDRKWVVHRLCPVSIMFTDYYFYLIAFLTDGKNEKPYYFRVDRIKQITIHRKKFEVLDFDEGLLRKRSLFMWPGKLRTIRFEFSGPSVQAALDKIPTAKIIECLGKNKYLIEAEVYGDGIKMWLLSQGTWVKVVAPADFVDEIKMEIDSMNLMYQKFHWRDLMKEQKFSSLTWS